MHSGCVAILLHCKGDVSRVLSRAASIRGGASDAALHRGRPGYEDSQRLPPCSTVFCSRLRSFPSEFTDRNCFANALAMWIVHVEPDERWHQPQRQPSDGMVWAIPVRPRRAKTVARFPDRFQSQDRMAEPDQLPAAPGAVGQVQTVLERLLNNPIWDCVL